MKKLLLSLALLSWGSTQAQLSFEGIYLQNGAFYGAGKGSVSDFQTLAPQSVLLQQDLSVYQAYPVMNFTFPGQSQSSSLPEHHFYQQRHRGQHRIVQQHAALRVL